MKKPLNLNIEQELHKKVKEYAEGNDLTMTEIITTFLEDLIEGRFAMEKETKIQLFTVEKKNELKNMEEYK